MDGISLAGWIEGDPLAHRLTAWQSWPMCNEYARRISLDQLRAGWGATDMAMLFPEGMPNMPALESIRITDPAAIIRAAGGDAAGAELVTRRWSWPSPNGKPVYNFRSDGREFANKADSGRCLIPGDGFYEYTDAPEEQAGTVDLFGTVAAKPARKARKAKWELSVPGLDWFCIAGLWRTDPAVGEAWTMLTTEPGPDIAPYHDRQVVVLTPPDYARWLSGEAPATELCRPLPAGTLKAKRII
jgi:putative SOS response-associated peptidase YedK